MESLHGVHTEWQHLPNKENLGRSRALSSPATPSTPTAAQIPVRPATPGSTTTSTASTVQSSSLSSSAPAVPAKDVPASQQATAGTEQASAKPMPKRPAVLNRASSKETSNDNVKGSRRSSWISNISSKFSSQPQTQTQTQAASSAPKTSTSGPSGTPGASVGQTPRSSAPQSPQTKGSEPEELQPYVPQKPKESNSSFLSSLTRRLSSGSQAGGSGRLAESGGVCPRRTLNVDPNRQRCKLGELDAARLKRVSFSVDVEIASGPKYRDDDASPDDKQKKTKDKKIKERAEGEALKDPKAATEKKDHEIEANSAPVDEQLARVDTSSAPASSPQSPEIPVDGLSEADKARAEEERRERKEKRRRKAEESGSAPMELNAADDQKTSSANGSTDKPKTSDRPTTDPVRIYRRCCQLRESPILKRITEQLMSPTCTLPNDPGTVDCLDLTNSRLQETDYITLGDWLAVVPVKRLILTNADISDEGLRCVLAGLLASKKPQPTKLQRNNSEDRSAGNAGQSQLGVVERLVLKGNSRISPVGWKHIACFINMCRSIKALDLSMISFPVHLPQNRASKFAKSPPEINQSSTDAATVVAKALAERLGGSTLEEISFSECNMSGEQIQKIVEAAKVCRLGRMSFAGTNLDDQGLDAIFGYIRTGFCYAIDIGSNDLRGKLGRLASALNETPNCRIWGLSLVNCNLDTETMRELFPALVGLPDFRFIDISHNKHLFDNDEAGGVHLLRKYIPKMKNLVRLHLSDVGLNTKQVIALAEILPEGPRLVHVNLLENDEITALASKTDESSQEEACALYASLMAAARVSSTIVCIDIAAPDPKNSEIVKALARQMVAYCLRNMETSPTMNPEAKANIASELTKPHREDGSSEMTVPDVLLQLIGQVDGMRANIDHDGPSPDDDYIVGGNGVVKALQYCLGEKAQELRRGSTTASGYTTPKDKDSAVGGELKQRGKAKEMSNYLLETARTIRARLRPALLREAVSGETMAYRRLTFLDATLEKMIMRFEEEFPETRAEPASPKQYAAVESPVGSVASLGSVEGPTFTDTLGSRMPVSGLSPEARSMPWDEDDASTAVMRPRASRHGSDVNLASRALALEEGHIHRLGQGLRRDILNAQSPVDAHNNSNSNLPTPQPQGATTTIQPPHTDPHLQDLAVRLENLSGPELNTILADGGWSQVMDKVGANIEELRQLQEADPTGWEQFKESQMKARMNVGQRGEGAVVE